MPDSLRGVVPVRVAAHFHLRAVSAAGMPRDLYDVLMRCLHTREPVPPAAWKYTPPLRLPTRDETSMMLELTPPGKGAVPQLFSVLDWEVLESGVDSEVKVWIPMSFVGTAASSSGWIYRADIGYDPGFNSKEHFSLA